MVDRAIGDGVREEHASYSHSPPSALSIRIGDYVRSQPPQERRPGGFGMMTRLALYGTVIDIHPSGKYVKIHIDRRKAKRHRWVLMESIRLLTKKEDRN